MKRWILAAVCVVPVTAALPQPARADGLLTPFAGVTFGGDSATKPVYGAAIGFMGAGILGLEAEVGYSPDFFDRDEDFSFVSEDNVVTVMVNLIVGAPIGGTRGPGVRPYATAGAGLMRVDVKGANDVFDHVTHNDFGVNVGAGLLAFFNDHAGLRADARYFRRLTDPEADNEFDIALGDFDFWRGTLGLSLRF